VVIHEEFEPRPARLAAGGDPLLGDARRVGLVVLGSPVE
jgi:hypothetical protein